MSDLGPVVVRHTVDAPQDAVWQLLTDASSREAWWPDVQIALEIGGDVITPDLTGTVDVLVNELTLGLRWSRPDDESDRTVVVMLRPEDDNLDQTRITVIESGFATLPDAADAVQTATEGWSNRWQALAAAAHPEANAVADAPTVEDDVTEAALSETDVSDADATQADVTQADVTQAQSEPAASADADAEPGTDPLEPDTDDDVVAELIDDADGEASADAGDPSEPDAGAVPSEDTPDVIDAELIDDDADSDEKPDDEAIDERSIIEIVTDDVIDAETIESSDAIFLPEVSGAPFTDSVVQITADLGVDEPVEVDETSEWERLLRGDDIER